MNISLAPEHGTTLSDSTAAATVSSVRTVVDPTQKTLPPLALHAFIASAVSGGTVNASKSMWWSSMFSALTGRNVPGPTCSVTATRFTPFGKNRARRTETLRKSLGNAGSSYGGEAPLCLRGLGCAAASECLCPPTFLQQKSHSLERKVQHLEQGNDRPAGGGRLVTL